MHLREASNNNSPPTPNSAPLHRTEMINNVVQVIDGNIKVFINKIFDRRDKDFNMLKHKVDKLNKDCAELNNNDNQLRGLSNGLRDVLKRYIIKEKRVLRKYVVMVLGSRYCAQIISVCVVKFIVYKSSIATENNRSKKIA